MTIFVFDPNPLFCNAIARMVESLTPNTKATDLRLLFDFSSEAAKLEEEPQLLITEVNEVNDGSHEYLLGLKRFYPELRIVAMTSGEIEAIEPFCKACGASLVVSKNLQVSELNSVFNDYLVEAFGMNDSDESVSVEKVSKRQRQLLRMIELGLSNRDMANELKISEHTVKVHFWRLFKRLNVSSRTMALAVARKRGLIADPLQKQPTRRKSVPTPFARLDTQEA